MSAKRKAREFQNEMKDSAHKIWLAGLGAMAAAEEEGSKLFRNLVEKGERIEDRGRQQVEKAKDTMDGVKTVAERYWDTFSNTLDDRVTAIIHRIGVPTKDEIETLTKKVENHTSSVEKLRVKQTATPPATKAPAAKKTAAPKKTETSSK
jgi:poly(hydroxyalkanoate) granule-associated protein